MLLFSRNNSAAESPAVSWLPGAESSLRGSLAPVEPSSVFGLRSGETKCPEGGCQGGRHSLESSVAGKTAGPSFGIWQCPSGATSILTLLCCPTCNRNLRTSAFVGTSSNPCVVSVCMCVICLLSLPSLQLRCGPAGYCRIWKRFPSAPLPNILQIAPGRFLQGALLTIIG